MISTVRDHSKYMQRALDLAGLGLGRVSPNPMVGCVIVHQDRIIAEGWHRQFGGSHGEVNAINSIADKRLLPESTLYVNLEPCAHYGKTPPCTDLIIASGIKKVIIANQDPNPMVSGKGIEQLRQTGVVVIEGVLEHAGAFLNRRFFSFHLHQRPYILLKWAQTRDGFMARLNHDSRWISNLQSRQLVHKFRSQEDAILVGRKTAHYDNPKLTVRDWEGRDPLRVVIDSNLVLKDNLNLFNGFVPTLCYNCVKNDHGSNTEYIKAPKNDMLSFLLGDLFRRNVQSLLVEGGAKLLASMIAAGIWDEARVFTSHTVFGEGICAPHIPIPWHHERIISGDSLKTYFNSHAPH